MLVDGTENIDVMKIPPPIYGDIKDVVSAYVSSRHDGLASIKTALKRPRVRFLLELHTHHH